MVSGILPGRCWQRSARPERQYLELRVTDGDRIHQRPDGRGAVGLSGGRTRSGVSGVCAVIAGSVYLEINTPRRHLLMKLEPDY
jgi:hypothetical protein